MLIVVGIFRLVAKLNHTHTVGDIRQFIEA